MNFQTFYSVLKRKKKLKNSATCTRTWHLCTLSLFLYFTLIFAVLADPDTQKSKKNYRIHLYSYIHSQENSITIFVLIVWRKIKPKNNQRTQRKFKKFVERKFPCSSVFSPPLLFYDVLSRNLVELNFPFFFESINCRPRLYSKFEFDDLPHPSSGALREKLQKFNYLYATSMLLSLELRSDEAMMKNVKRSSVYRQTTSAIIRII